MALAIDTTAGNSGSKATGANLVSNSFSTAAANELILALVASSGGPNAGASCTGTVSGAGLTWHLVKRQNTRAGSSEIWYAFATSALTSVTASVSFSWTGGGTGGTLIQVVALTGIDTTSGDGSSAIGASNSAGAASGAPTCSLTTTASGSWVFGVGNDWDNAATVTAASGQSIPRVFKDTSDGDVQWAQEQNATTPSSGTVVTINDTAPTADQWQLAIVEILAASGPPPTTPTQRLCLLGCGN